MMARVSEAVLLMVVFASAVSGFLPGSLLGLSKTLASRKSSPTKTTKPGSHGGFTVTSRKCHVMRRTTDLEKIQVPSLCHSVSGKAVNLPRPLDSKALPALLAMKAGGWSLCYKPQTVPVTKLRKIPVCCPGTTPTYYGGCLVKKAGPPASSPAPGRRTANPSRKTRGKVTATSTTSNNQLVTASFPAVLAASNMARSYSRLLANGRPKTARHTAPLGLPRARGSGTFLTVNGSITLNSQSAKPRRPGATPLPRPQPNPLVNPMLAGPLSLWLRNPYSSRARKDPLFSSFLFRSTRPQSAKTKVRAGPKLPPAQSLAKMLLSSPLWKTGPLGKLKSRSSGSLSKATSTGSASKSRSALAKARANGPFTKGYRPARPAFPFPGKPSFAPMRPFAPFPPPVGPFSSKLNPVSAFFKPGSSNAQPGFGPLTPRRFMTSPFSRPSPGSRLRQLALMSALSSMGPKPQPLSASPSAKRPVASPSPRTVSKGPKSGVQETGPLSKVNPPVPLSKVRSAGALSSLWNSGPLSLVSPPRSVYSPSPASQFRLGSPVSGQNPAPPSSKVASPGPRYRVSPTGPLSLSSQSRTSQASLHTNPLSATYASRSGKPLSKSSLPLPSSYNTATRYRPPRPSGGPLSHRSPSERPSAGGKGSSSRSSSDWQEDVARYLATMIYHKLLVEQQHKAVLSEVGRQNRIRQQMEFFIRQLKLLSRQQQQQQQKLQQQQQQQPQQQQNSPPTTDSQSAPLAEPSPIPTPPLQTTITTSTQTSPAPDQTTAKEEETVVITTEILDEIPTLGQPPAAAQPQITDNDPGQGRAARLMELKEKAKAVINHCLAEANVTTTMEQVLHSGDPSSFAPICRASATVGPCVMGKVQELMGRDPFSQLSVRMVQSALFALGKTCMQLQQAEQLAQTTDEETNPPVVHTEAIPGPTTEQEVEQLAQTTDEETNPPVVHTEAIPGLTTEQEAEQLAQTTDDETNPPVVHADAIPGLTTEQEAEQRAQTADYETNPPVIHTEAIPGLSVEQEVKPPTTSQTVDAASEAEDTDYIDSEAPISPEITVQQQTPRPVSFENSVETTLADKAAPKGALDTKKQDRRTELFVEVAEDDFPSWTIVAVVAGCITILFLFLSTVCLVLRYQRRNKVVEVERQPQKLEPTLSIHSTSGEASLPARCSSAGIDTEFKIPEDNARTS